VTQAPVDPEPEVAETSNRGSLADEMTSSNIVAAETFKDQEIEVKEPKAKETKAEKP